MLVARRRGLRQTISSRCLSKRLGKSAIYPESPDLRSRMLPSCNLIYKVMPFSLACLLRPGWDLALHIPTTRCRIIQTVHRCSHSICGPFLCSAPETYGASYSAHLSLVQIPRDDKEHDRNPTIIAVPYTDSSSCRKEHPLESKLRGMEGPYSWEKCQVYQKSDFEEEQRLQRKREDTHEKELRNRAMKPMAATSPKPTKRKSFFTPPQDNKAKDVERAERA